LDVVWGSNYIGAEEVITFLVCFTLIYTRGRIKYEMKTHLCILPAIIR
jgi:hypothetical protein